MVLQNNCLPEHCRRVTEDLLGPRSALRERVTIREYDRSLPLTHLWNEALLRTDTPWVLICNDDIQFDSGWYEVFKSLRAGFPKARQINLAYPHSSYSAFALHRSLISDIGWFDPDFPAFRWEDEDWHLRLSEFVGYDVAEEWRGGERRADALVVWGEGVKNSHSQRAADIAHYGSLRWDLDPKANERAFWGKWRPADDGWMTKGAVKDKKKLRVKRVRDTRMPVGVTQSLTESYRHA